MHSRALNRVAEIAGVGVGALDLDAQVSHRRVDEAGLPHVPKLTAVPEPPSLVDLRKRVAAKLPRLDLPEVILEGPRSGRCHRPQGSYA